MDEGGDRSSTQDGSDADIAFTCTPCSEEGTREEAIRYCTECEEYLCTTCTKYHAKMKATRYHKLVDREEGEHESKVAITTTKMKCRQHPDRVIEMYCGSHDMVYCSMCIATEHRSCTDVSSLADASGTNIQENEIGHLLEESESIKELLVDTEKKKQDNIALLEKKRNKIQTRVQEIEDSMVEHIKTLSKQINVTLDETHSHIKGELESEIAMISHRGIEVGKVKEQLQSMAEVNQEHKFSQYKLSQMIVNDAKTLHAKLEFNGRISIEFAENTSVTEQLFEVKTLGKIEKSRVSSSGEIKRQKEINCRMQSDNNPCRIIDICQLDSGACILADLRNRKVKLLDIYYSVIDHFTVGGKPTAICKISRNEVAVKLDTNEIELLSVGPRVCKVRSISIKKGGEFWGMTYTGRKFWVANGHYVEIYNTNGLLEQSVKRDTTGQKIFKSTPIQMTVFQNLVHVADNSNGIVCLRSDGTKKSELRDSRLKQTAGVCVSCNGTVYAIDECSKTIVMFSQDGQCLGSLIPEVPKEKVPDSLCYGSKYSCLLVGYTSSDTVTVLYLSD